MADNAGLAAALDGIPMVADAAARDARFPLATRKQNQRVFRLDTLVQERWSGSVWVDDTVRTVNVRAYGATGDGTTDDTDAIVAAYAAAVGATAGVTLLFPAGTYRYSGTSLGNLKRNGLTLQGAGHRQTVLKCTSAGVALSLDAFSAQTGSEPFLNMALRGLTVEGNAGTTVGIFARGIARSRWEDVVVREGEPTSGIAFQFQGCSLNTFTNLLCSTDLDTMASVPYEGLRLEAGSRGGGGGSVGNSSNNTFTGTYMEGLSIGIRLSGADQNTFVGGSPESCAVNGLIVAAGSRYNSFVGTGFENPDSTADISDAGLSTKYLNCYSAKKVAIESGSRSVRVEGGVFERIEVVAGASKANVRDVTVNQFATGSGGFVDNGTATEAKNIYDADLAAYLTPVKDRSAIAVGASPFRYTNTTGRYEEVHISGGTVTQVLQYRGADFWATPTLDNLQRLLAPGDQLDVSYSSVPTMSHIPCAGFPG